MLVGGYQNGVCVHLDFFFLNSDRIISESDLIGIPINGLVLSDSDLTGLA